MISLTPFSMVFVVASEEKKNLDGEISLDVALKVLRISLTEVLTLEETLQGAEKAKEESN